MPFRLLPDQGSRRINITNLTFRLLQILLALIVIITYASLQRQLGGVPFTTSSSGPLSLIYAAAALSFLTAIAFIYIPTRWGFRPVAILFIWDFVLFCLWAAAFTYMKKSIPAGYTKEKWVDRAYEAVCGYNGGNDRNDNCIISRKALGTFWDAAWLLLPNLLLWLGNMLAGIWALWLARGKARGRGGGSYEL